MVIDDQINKINHEKYLQLIKEKDAQGVDLNAFFDYFDMGNFHDRKDAATLLNYIETKEYSNEPKQIKQNNTQSRIAQLAVALTGPGHNKHSLSYEMKCRGLCIEDMIRNYLGYSIQDKQNTIKVFKTLGLHETEDTTIKDDSLKYVNIERQLKNEKIREKYSLEKRITLPESSTITTPKKQYIQTSAQEPKKTLWGKIKNTLNSFKESSYNIFTGFAYQR